MIRRSFLRGVALGSGATLLNPVLDGVQARADGRAPAARRFVFVLLGNGLRPNLLTPDTVTRPAKSDRLTDVSLKDHKLPPVLEPLEDLKGRVTVVQGLSGRVCGGGHSNHYGALGQFPWRKGAYAETVDAALAKLQPAVFPQLCLGMAGNPDRTVEFGISARGPDQPVPILLRPRAAYDHVFGCVAGGDAGKAFTARTNVLDFLRDDAKRAGRALGRTEREHLGAHLQALDDMHARRDRLKELEPALRKHAPAVDPRFESDVETDRLEAQFDIAAAALVCGATRVATICSGVSHFWTVLFRGLGLDTNTHQIGHGKGAGGKTAADLAAVIRRHHVGLVARLAKKLDAVPEGDGTMLDNTLIVFLSDAAEGHHSSCHEWPLVLVGGCGGRLKTGRYLDYPSYGRKGHRTVAALYTTLLAAAGSKAESFGVPDPNLDAADQKGPLSELLA